MSDGKILEAALKKDALREHYCKRARENLGCSRIDKAAYKLEIEAIDKRYEFTEAEKKAFEQAMIKNFKRA